MLWMQTMMDILQIMTQVTHVSIQTTTILADLTLQLETVISMVTATLTRCGAATTAC